jgi:putative FmdB family regulatory protein
VDWELRAGSKRRLTMIELTQIESIGPERKEVRMPVYEFDCRECNNRFQELMPVSEWEKKRKDGFKCPKCGSKNVEEVLSASVQTSKKS